MAASFNKLDKSAPEKPGVLLAIVSVSTSPSNLLFFACTFKISILPFKSGTSTETCLSKRPGRNNAGSRMSALFVAATTMTPVLPSKPSISVNNWFNVCSLSSLPPPTPVPLDRPTASISSTKTMHGAFSFAFLNKSLTLEAPTPTNISTNSEPEMEKPNLFLFSLVVLLPVALYPSSLSFPHPSWQNPNECPHQSFGLGGNVNLTVTISSKGEPSLALFLLLSFFFSFFDYFFSFFFFFSSSSSH